jgi:hypothetical protein
MVRLQSLQSLKDHLVPFFFTQVPATKTRKGMSLFPFLSHAASRADSAP